MRRWMLTAVIAVALIAAIFGQSCNANGEQKAEEIARDFIKNCATFQYDGMEDTLKLVETLYPDIENAWQFIFHFESYHAGYGDRTGQILAQVITPHEAIITVENGEVKSAVMDEKWDMVNQKMLSEGG